MSKKVIQYFTVLLRKIFIQMTTKKNTKEIKVENTKDLSKAITELNKTVNQLAPPKLRKHGFEVGKSYFVRTVTHHQIGKVVELCEMSMILEGACWVADNGRFSTLMSGEWDSDSELEMFSDKQEVQVFFGGIIDAASWPYDLPIRSK